MTIPSPLSAQIAKYLPASTAAHLSERLRHLDRMAGIDDEQGATVHARGEERRKRRVATQQNLEITKANHARGLATHDEVREAELADKDRQKRNEEEDRKDNTILQRAADSTAVLVSTIRSMNGVKWPTEQKSLVHFEHDHSRPDPADLGPDVRVVSPRLPEGDRHAIFSEQQAAVARLKGEAEDVDHAPDRKETTKRRARQQLEELAARGAPKVSGAGEPGVRLSIRPPLMDIGAEPGLSSSGNIPKAHDALALLAWAMPERVLEAVEASIDAAYLGVDVQLDPHERQRRKREIKAKILAAERIECEAIWQLIEQGDDSVRFRPDTDPRAILGIA